MAETRHVCMVSTSVTIRVRASGTVTVHLQSGSFGLSLGNLMR